MIRTVHVTNAYHPGSGGIRTFYRALVDEANRRGRSLRLIVPAARHGVEDVGEHARIHCVRAPRSPWIDSRYRVLLPSQFLLPGRRLARILREEQPDLGRRRRGDPARPEPGRSRGLGEAQSGGPRQGLRRSSAPLPAAPSTSPPR